MNQYDHPTDEILLKVIANDDAETDALKIETHISNCDACQTRLMSLTDDGWLKDYRDCLSADLLSESTCSGIGEFTGTPPRSRTPQNENEFERGAIEQMLNKILAPPSHPELLGRLGRYDVERIIGVGGMGLVLKGYDGELQRPVAIKMIIPRLANNGTAKQRFTREARAVAAILHPNIIAVHGIEETNGMPWFAMPFVAGPSLKELVQRTGPLPEREIARIGLQIASGLAAAHGQGVVHRDIKPDNVLVDNEINRVVITDFGLARRETEETITRTGVLAGSLNYMSPEQTRGEEVDGRSDLFSLGSLLYFLATGTAPFRADTAAAVLHNVSNKPAPDIRSLNPELSKTLAGAIDRLLAKKPDQRFQSATELESFFERFVSHLNQPTKHRLPAVPGFNQKTTYWIAGTLFATAALALGVCAYLYLPNPEPSKLTAESIWNQLRAEYDLTSPSEFDKEMTDLRVDFNRLENSFDSFEDYESSQLSNDAHSLRRSFESIESAIERMGSVPKK